MARPVIPDVFDVSHLTFVAIANPFYLLGTILLYSVHLLGVILAQSLELLTLVLLDIVQHLVDLLGSRSGTDVPAAHAAV